MKHIVNFTLMICTLALGLGLMEMLVRNMPAAERLGWNLVPILPDRMDRIGEPGTDRRVVVVGDSFTEWMETSGGNFVRIAERKLREQGQKIEFVNMGEAGTGMSDYYRNLVNYGPRLKPETVIIALYLGNDLTPFPGGLPSPDQIKTILPVPPYDRSWRKMLKKSVLLNLIYRQAKLHIPWLRSGFTEEVLEYLRTRHRQDKDFVIRRLMALDPQIRQQVEADAINAWDLATALFSPDYYQDLADAAPDSEAGRAALASLTDIKSLVSYVRSLSARPVVVLIPPSPWVGTSYHGYFQRLGYGRLGPVDDEPIIATHVKALLDAEDVAYLDLLPALRRSPESVYLDQDIHFNAHGQAVAGAELARFLAKP